MGRWNDKEKALDLNNDGVDLFEQGGLDKSE